MSHVAKIDLEITDLDSLAEACKALGLELILNQQQYKWYGVSVGDYPLPEGFKVEDLGNCLHAIKIPGNSQAYEIGVVKRRDGKPGYTLLWDFYAGGLGLQAKVGHEGGLLKQSYAIARAKKHLTRQGYTKIRQKVNSDGTIVLTVR